jgi:hypothetical protein
MKTKPLLILCLLLSWSCQTKNSAAWRPLFNGENLEGWDTYLGPSYDSISKKMDSTKVVGLNNDINGVFKVVQIDNRTALRISGQNFGGISTSEEFKNFHLKLEFKWGSLKSNPRKDRKRDSGLLYHAVGAHGADYGFWMRSQEFQIQEGDCGDYWGVAGAIMDVPAEGSEREKYVYNAKGKLLTFSEQSAQYRRCNKNSDAENPSGEWNTVELYCMGDTAVHVMNGKTVMVLYRSRQLDGDKETPLKQGKIQLQSEGAEIFYRAIQIQPISRIPEDILNPE